MAVDLQVASDILVQVIVNEPDVMTLDQYQAAPGAVSAGHSLQVAAASNVALRSDDVDAVPFEVRQLVAVEGRDSGVQASDCAEDQAAAREDVWVGIAGVAKGLAVNLVDLVYDYCSATAVLAPRR